MQTYAPPSRSLGQAALIVGVIAIGCLLAVLFGTATALLPWYFIVMVVVFFLLLPLSVRFPELGILAVFLLVFEAVPAAFVPGLPLAGGTVKLYDLLLISTALSLLVHTWMRRQSVLVPLKGVVFPLLYVFACVLMSYIYGKLIMQNKLATADARNAVGWLMLPMLLIVLDTPRKLRMLVISMLCIGLLISIYGAAQSFFDIRILSHRVEALSGAQVEEGGVTRSILGAGAFLGIFAIYYFTMMLVARKLRWWIALPLAVIAVIGLAVSFTRALWAGAFVGALVAFYLYRGPVAAVLAAAASALAVAVALLVIGAVKPQMAEAVIDRATGIQQEVRTGGSFNWRRLENEDALKAIVEKPLTGVGMGGEYKKVKSTVGGFVGEYGYIHNGYMWYPLKMGVLGALVPILFTFVFFTALRRSLVDATPADRIIPAAATGVFVTLLLASFVEPHWVRGETLVIIGTLLAIVIAIPRLKAAQGFRASAEVPPSDAPQVVRLDRGSPWRPPRVRT